MLFRPWRDVRNFISAVILYDKTNLAKSQDATPLVKADRQAGAITRIKKTFDRGTQVRCRAPCPVELFTVGPRQLALAARLADYSKAGALAFAKWRPAR